MSEELFVILLFLAVSDVLLPFILSELVLTLELYIFPEAVPVLLLILSRRTIIRIITASAAMPADYQAFHWNYDNFSRRIHVHTSLY